MVHRRHRDPDQPCTGGTPVPEHLVRKLQVPVRGFERPDPVREFRLRAGSPAPRLPAAVQACHLHRFHLRASRECHLLEHPYRRRPRTRGIEPVLQLDGRPDSVHPPRRPLQHHLHERFDGSAQGRGTHPQERAGADPEPSRALPHEPEGRLLPHDIAGRARVRAHGGLLLHAERGPHLLRRHAEECRDHADRGLPHRDDRGPAHPRAPLREHDHHRRQGEGPQTSPHPERHQARQDQRTRKGPFHNAAHLRPARLPQDARRARRKVQAHRERKLRLEQVYPQVPPEHATA